MPLREWEHWQVSMHGVARAPATIELLATGVAPGRHRIEATLESQIDAMAQDIKVAADLVLHAG